MFRQRLNHGFLFVFCLVLSWPVCCQFAFIVWQPLAVVTPNSLDLQCSLGNTSTLTTVSLLHGKATVAHIEVYPNRTLHHDHQGETFSVIGLQDSLMFSKLSTLNDAGLYTCQFKQNGTSSDHEMYNVTVKGRPITSLDKTSPLEVYTQDSVSIHCLASGNPGPIVYWVKSSSNDVSVSSSSDLSFPSIAFGDAGSYACMAKNTYGNSSTSVTVVVKDTKPGIPTKVQVTGKREDSITLQWNRGKPGKSNITYYTFTVNTTSFTEKGDITRHRISKLAADTVFLVKIQACNVHGCGKAAMLVVRTLTEGVPSPPTNLKHVSSTSSSVTLSWVHGGNTTKIIAYSYVTYQRLDLPFKNDKTVNGERHVFTVGDLEAYKEYEFTVKTCVLGTPFPLCSLASAPLISMTAIAAPTEPTNVQIFNTIESEVAIRVTWSPPRELNGPPDINYRIYFRANLSTIWAKEEVIVPPPGGNDRRRRSTLLPLTHVLAKLLPRTLYWIKVAAYSSAGLANSTGYSIRTDEAPPNMPLNLTLVRRTSNSLTIVWNAPVLDPRASNVYNVYARDTVTLKSYAFVINHATETTIERLIANTTYNISVSITLERQRDKEKLTGPAAIAAYTTEMHIIDPPTDEPSQAPLVAATVISLLAVTLAMVIAVWYCRRKNLLGVTYKSTFYVEEDSVPLSLRRSIRQSAKRHAIAVDKFPDYVAKLHKDSDYLFSEEYGSLSAARGDLTWVHSTSNLNQPKNRYPDIVAYDHSRVRLMSIDGVPSSNYINANFVDGYKRSDAYIATQAPLSRTVDDFWRMIWEQDSRIIIMVTNLWERGRRKCDQYWPTDGQQVFVDVTVDKVLEKTYASYIMRTFLVKRNQSDQDPGDEEKPRTIYQYHFTDWPDYGVPQDKATVLAFIAKTRHHEPDHKGPSLVHCSAGVGRSGTFIALDVQMRRVDKERTVDIYNFVRHMRSQRNFMVQQEGQFVFIYDALLEYIQFGSTEISVDGLEKNIENKYETVSQKTGRDAIATEWMNISNMKIPDHTMNIGKRPCNFRKNRDPCIIPVDSGRARLTMRAAAEGTDYINASYIDSHVEKRALIVTQAPLPDTVEDFWRLIWENVTMVVVSLLSREELHEADFCDYMPRKDCNPINFGAFEIECLVETSYTDFTMRNIRLKHRIECGESEHRDIWHFHFRGWPEDQFPCSENVFEMIKLAKQKQLETDMKRTKYESHPLVFHCSCGVGRTGVFCALFNLWEQLSDDVGVVDIATTVKVLRNQRPFMIQTEDEYNYLYRAVVQMQTFMRNVEETETSNC